MESLPGAPRWETSGLVTVPGLRQLGIQATRPPYPQPQQVGDREWGRMPGPHWLCRGQEAPTGAREQTGNLGGTRRCGTQQGGVADSGRGSARGPARAQRSGHRWPVQSCLLTWEVWVRPAQSPPWKQDLAGQSRPPRGRDCVRMRGCDHDNCGSDTSSSGGGRAASASDCDRRGRSSWAAQAAPQAGRSRQCHPCGAQEAAGDRAGDTPAADVKPPPLQMLHL